MFGRKRSDEDFAEEIKAHLEMEAEELKSEGLSEEEARRQSAAWSSAMSRVVQERFYLQEPLARSRQAAPRSALWIAFAAAKPGIRAHRHPDARRSAWARTQRCSA